MWLLWFMFLGPAALITATIVAATISQRPSWLVGQICAGVVLIVLAWQIGDWAGAYQDTDPEGCSDCGEREAFALVALLASCAAWTVGTALGGAIGYALRRQLRTR